MSNDLAAWRSQVTCLPAQPETDVKKSGSIASIYPLDQSSKPKCLKGTARPLVRWAGWDYGRPSKRGTNHNLGLGHSHHKTMPPQKKKKECRHRPESLIFSEYRNKEFLCEISQASKHCQAREHIHRCDPTHKHHFSPHDSVAATAAKSLQSCSTLWDPMDSSPPGSSVHRILWARILEWVAISFSTW